MVIKPALLVLLALLGATPAVAQTAHPKYGLISCTYDRLTPRERQVLWALDQPGVSKAEFNRVVRRRGDMSEACRKDLGWNGELQQQAFQYARHRMDVDRHISSHVERGGKAEDIVAVFESWTAEERAIVFQRGLLGSGAIAQRAKTVLGENGIDPVSAIFALTAYAKVRAMEQAWAGRP